MKVCSLCNKFNRNAIMFHKIFLPCQSLSKEKVLCWNSFLFFPIFFPTLLTDVVQFTIEFHSLEKYWMHDYVKVPSKCCSTKLKGFKSFVRRPLIVNRNLCNSSSRQVLVLSTRYMFGFPCLSFLYWIDTRWIEY